MFSVPTKRVRDGRPPRATRSYDSVLCRNRTSGWCNRSAFFFLSELIVFTTRALYVYVIYSNSAITEHNRRNKV